jgi:DNA/RNA-binding domain of Phe-tRNA-synthetase-like protein
MAKVSQIFKNGVDSTEKYSLNIFKSILGRNLNLLKSGTSARDTRKIIIDPRIYDLGLKGIYLTLTGVKNKVFDPDFEKYRQEVIKGAYKYVRSIPDIKDELEIRGFRHLHEAVGAPNRKNLSAPETLYRILNRNGDIPHINLLVDIYNTISVKYKLAIGAHDWDKIDGNVNLRFTNGSEKFIPLGEHEPKHIRAGEYSYIDDSNEIICYLEVRQIDKTKVTLDTKDVFFVIQGNEITPYSYIEQVTNELILLVKKYCGGKVNRIGAVSGKVKKRN